ncbi:MAG: methyltransferase domain-containing protein [Flavobacteriales bacterium]
MKLKDTLKRKLSKRQYELARMLAFEFKRWRSRASAPLKFETKFKRLHLGCGDRLLEGWLNVDMIGSDLDLDFASGKLPFPDGQFDSIVSQHVIEHLSLEDELVPLFKECHRCMSSEGWIWISTPDMKKVAKSYLDHNNEDMIADRKKRLPDWTLGEYPPQQFMNDIFHQGLEHRNLFDFGLLKWTLESSGFSSVQESNERELLAAFPEFPVRNDDFQSIYVKAQKS